MGATVPRRRRVVWAGIVVVLVVLLGGCGPQTPYDPRLACEGSGGIYTADGRCLAGNM